MAGKIDARLKELGIELPNLTAPAANYVPTVRTGNLLFVSGQIPMIDGKISFQGRVGVDMDWETAYQAARVCALNTLAHVRNALDGDLDRVVRCVKVLGFVNVSPDFGDAPKIINGASDLIVAVLEEKGRHARSAVGAGGLPFGVAAEIEAIFEVV